MDLDGELMPSDVCVVMCALFLIQHFERARERDRERANCEQISKKKNIQMNYAYCSIYLQATKRATTAHATQYSSMEMNAEFRIRCIQIAQRALLSVINDCESFSVSAAIYVDPYISVLPPTGILNANCSTSFDISNTFDAIYFEVHCGQTSECDRCVWK